MPNWTGFAIAVGVLTILLLLLTRHSQRTLERLDVEGDRSTPNRGFDRELTDSCSDEELTSPSSDEKLTSPSSDRESIRSESERKLRDPVARGHDGPATRGSVEESADRPTRERKRPETETGTDRAASTTRSDRHVATERAESSGRAMGGPPTVTTRLLLVNVVVTQGLFLLALTAIAWWSDVSWGAFGIEPGTISVQAIGYGVLAGVGLYLTSELGAGVGQRFGFEPPTRLRSALAPTTRDEWILLLFVVLPTIAVFEEALFRGALIGVLWLGVGIDPWLLAVGSSIAFGFGHGAQGRVGIAVTGVLGFVLAAAFILTESLLVVIVAHYVINALEFLVREGFGWEPV